MKFCLFEFCLDPGQRVDLNNIIDNVGLKDGRQKGKKKKSRGLSSIIIIIFILISTWKISSSLATLRCSRRCLINLKAISKPWKKNLMSSLDYWMFWSQVATLYIFIDCWWWLSWSSRDWLILRDHPAPSPVSPITQLTSLLPSTFSVFEIKLKIFSKKLN